MRCPFCGGEVRFKWPRLIYCVLSILIISHLGVWTLLNLKIESWTLPTFLMLSALSYFSMAGLILYTLTEFIKEKLKKRR